VKNLRVLLLAGAVTCSIATPSEARITTLDRCVSSIVNDVLHFVAKKSQCIRACEDAVRANRLDPFTRCQAPSNHGPTAKCLAMADERILGARSHTRKVCQDDEIALFYGNTTTCPCQNQTRLELLSCFQAQAETFVDDLLEQIYFPSGFCGDGQVSGSEVCDQSAFPNNGCGFPAFCFNCNFCFPFGSPGPAFLDEAPRDLVE